MRVDPSLVRTGQWWDHKLPPVIAAAALALLAGPATSGTTVLVDLVLFVVAAIGVAAFGHVVNDLSDLRTDAIAGAPNQMAALSPRGRSGILAATVLVGALPWLWLPHSATVMGLLALEVSLLVAYSVRPIRLKDRAAAGVLADALYAYVVPILLAIATFVEVSGGPPPGWQLIAPTSAWMLLMGLRGILWHQIADLAHDRAAGVHTLATRIGAQRASHLLGWSVLVELAAAGTTLVVAAGPTQSWWLPWFGACYVAYRCFQVTMLWSEPLRPSSLRSPNGRVRFVGYVLLNEFVESWLPVAALIAVAVREPLVWIGVIAYLVLFENAVFDFLGRDLPALPDALNRLAHERRARRNIVLVEQRRRRLIAAGPEELPQRARDDWRWVFVVCGPELHIETLATAVRNLRPVTQLEIWVVTDSRRNVRPLDIDGLDRVVDVETPAHLDDHQASIWLKTSVHRHVPAGEWCYLDSDIIAVRPGVERVFEADRGPVAFASDLTIAANQVDRFSPWAMTCACAGHGDTHSCSHLREQLAERFGLDVPGDWVHWNGGVFRFGDDSTEFLDMWHHRAVASFDWPEWRTRDQGALIATAWTLGLQDSPRLSADFNFIADLGNGELCLELERGWALRPAGPWHQPLMLHLYTSRLEDPRWDLGRDVEAPVIRQTLVRVNRFKRRDLRRRIHHRVRERLGIYMIRLRRLPTRLRPARLATSVRRRIGLDRPGGSQGS